MMTVLERRCPRHAGLVGLEDVAASCATDGMLRDYRSHVVTTILTRACHCRNLNAQSAPALSRSRRCSFRSALEWRSIRSDAWRGIRHKKGLLTEMANGQEGLACTGRSVHHVKDGIIHAASTCLTSAGFSAAERRRGRKRHHLRPLSPRPEHLEIAISPGAQIIADRR